MLGISSLKGKVMEVPGQIKGADQRVADHFLEKAATAKANRLNDLKTSLKSKKPESTQAYKEAYKSPGGVMERVNYQLGQPGRGGQASRAALYAGVGTGSVAAGAALTEGAQQLLALMGFMQTGQQVEQAKNTSPLNVG